MIELAEFAVLVAFLVIGGVWIDHSDPYGERRDARRRNGR